MATTSSTSLTTLPLAKH
uniref:Uncharacterized protein n=1 Tax=Rhizophora mucronata TaxID=61149 RepID=A0A2P2P6U6_RHIMU